MFFLLGLLSLGTRASDDAVPFGLDWGMTETELRLDGVLMFLRTHDTEHFTSYLVKDIPEALGDAGAHTVWLTAEHGLQRITVTGEIIRNDATGHKIKQRYKRLRKLLQERYGQPTRIREYSGRQKYTAYYEFYQCLEYQDCGNWASYYGRGPTTVSLRVHGVDRDSGYYRLIFKGPHWRNDWLESEQSAGIRSERFNDRESG